MTTVSRDNSENKAPHIPVLIRQVLETMPCEDGKTVVDGTFGAGGYSRAMLEAGAGQVIGIDRDPSVRRFADALATDFPERFRLLQGRFGEMQSLLAAEGIEQVDGIVLDLGVSSMQLDQAERGFSFRFDGPLDMRMGPDAPTAASVVNELDEAALADIFYQLGEERRARQVARAIVQARAEAPIETTERLADIVRSVVRKAADKIDPATRSFMALRLYVNDELGEVQRAMRAAEALLRPGGVLAIVSFHSLEDRLVKLFLRDRSTPPPSRTQGGSRHLPAPAPTGETVRQPTFRLANRQGMVADEAETRMNPRARSARLRSAIRTEAPAWEDAA